MEDLAYGAGVLGFCPGYLCGWRASCTTSDPCAKITVWRRGVLLWNPGIDFFRLRATLNPKSQFLRCSRQTSFSPSPNYLGRLTSQIASKNGGAKAVYMTLSFNQNS